MVPEELILIFHELRIEEVYRACPKSQLCEMGHKRWKERVVSIQFDLSYTSVKTSAVIGSKLQDTDQDSR